MGIVVHGTVGRPSLVESVGPYSARTHVREVESIGETARKPRHVDVERAVLILELKYLAHRTIPRLVANTGTNTFGVRTLGRELEVEAVVAGCDSENV